MKMVWWVLLVLVVLRGRFGVDGSDVTYDERSLIINGSRSLLFSGDIHYPRSTPEMWPSLISNAKEGGLDVIQTYVFWNVHEPVQGQYNFRGRYDLVRFLKEIKAQGLYASLRIGPFIESEWNYGGFPFWLHDVPGIVFRSDNEPFKLLMQNFTKRIVDLMKSEGLFASLGGPIILSQIENEYQNVEKAFHENGPPYVKWAAEMAVGLQTGVPWVMCKQDDAPDPLINACNGLSCGETFAGPNSANKPSIWTENWTTEYTVFGKESRRRSPEEVAFVVALFVAKKGSFVNYYMYHGGTNFGRSGSSFVTTNYYDEAPLDEYGLIRQPKWGHLKELHAALKLCTKPFLWGTPSNFSLGKLQEAHVYQGGGGCAAFLSNSDRQNNAVVTFQNVEYELPPRSISILPDCKNVVFNTAKVNSQYNVRSTVIRETLNSQERWGELVDRISNFGDTSLKADYLLEHTNTTKDVSDYLWYTFSYEHKSTGVQPVLNVDSRGHVLHAFVNNKFVGSSHGNHDTPGFSLQSSIPANNGKNNISLLSVMVGLPDSGAYLERRAFGLSKVTMEGSGQNDQWGYQIGLLGEELRLYSPEGSSKFEWREIGSSTRPQLMWYKTTFDAPGGDEPVALDLSSMGKGEAWVNGQSIGRYWPTYLKPNGQPSQTLYHVPRSFLIPSKNLLILFEEIGGDPLRISIVTISISSVHSNVSEGHPPFVKPRSQLECPPGRTISTVEFASFGTPLSDGENYILGSCHSSNSTSIVEKACLGKKSCSIGVSTDEFGGDPCPGILKYLFVDARCT